MRSWAAIAAISILTIGLSACGKYGPPVRSVVPQESRSRPRAIETQPQVPEEKIQEPAEFDDAETDEEAGP
jgi:hypothetical protein